MCDFETTVYSGQAHTEVWASACVELFHDEVTVVGSIDEQYEQFINMGCDVVAWYHNLKFDGAFWLSFLLVELGYEPLVTGDVEALELSWGKDEEMKDGQVKWAISDRGAWYRIVFKANGHVIELRDSLKLLPFSVRQIGESFGTKHKKLDMEYKGFRYAGCAITDEERRYIENDVLVVKEALEMMLSEGHDKLTIGSCCLAEYRSTMIRSDWEAFFPNLYEEPIDEARYGYATAGDYIHKSYRGGWCYLVHEKACKPLTGGCTADVNSLYPSVMSGASGNVYPVGEPTFWKGDVPSAAERDGRTYFVRVRCRFKIKPGMLPFIQIKRNGLYRATEMLTTSDVRDKDGVYHPFYIKGGELVPATVEMVLTKCDWERIQRHYDLSELEVLDGCWFSGEVGIFDQYIDKWAEVKRTSKGARRQLAKLFLNNLYGKMAASTDSSWKWCEPDKDGVLKFYDVIEYGKKPGYIPVGSAITSYARDFTIRAAQANYHGPDAPGFVYADTDSIHSDLDPAQVVGIEVHPTDFLKWKMESSWDEAWFVRQKTYMEHVVAHDLEPCDPEWDIKCAGMPERCKHLFLMSMGFPQTDVDGRPVVPKTDEEAAFVAVPRTYQDFKVGIRVPGKLLPKRLRGGIVLMDTTYEMH